MALSAVRRGAVGGFSTDANVTLGSTVEGTLSRGYSSQAKEHTREIEAESWAMIGQTRSAGAFASPRRQTRAGTGRPYYTFCWMEIKEPRPGPPRHFLDFELAWLGSTSVQPNFFKSVQALYYLTAHLISTHKLVHGTHLDTSSSPPAPPRGSSAPNFDARNETAIQHNFHQTQTTQHAMTTGTTTQCTGTHDTGSAVVLFYGRLTLPPLQESRLPPSPPPPRRRPRRRRPARRRRYPRTMSRRRVAKPRPPKTPRASRSPAACRSAEGSPPCCLGARREGETKEMAGPEIGGGGGVGRVRYRKGARCFGRNVLGGSAVHARPVRGLSVPDVLRCTPTYRQDEMVRSCRLFHRGWCATQI